MGGSREMDGRKDGQLSKRLFFFNDAEGIDVTV